MLSKKYIDIRFVWNRTNSISNIIYDDDANFLKNEKAKTPNLLSSQSH